MPELSFEVSYHDEHLIEILTATTNGRFSGASAIYLDSDGQQLIEMANRLKGFPKDVNQVEEIEFGSTQKDGNIFEAKSSTKTKVATAYLGLKFYCTNHAGHSVVSVKITEDSWSESSEAIGKASFEIRFEPSQIDNFVKEVIELGKKKSGKATLKGIQDEKTFLYNKGHFQSNRA